LQQRQVKPGKRGWQAPATLVSRLIKREKPTGKAYAFSLTYYLRFKPNKIPHRGLICEQDFDEYTAITGALRLRGI
jgi:hypothetical protein